jgi:hypothetical protein
VKKVEGINERSKKKRLKIEISFDEGDDHRRQSIVPLS